MEFRRIALQAVEHSSGFRVQIADRFHVEYLEDDRVGRITADLDSEPVRLHVGTLKWTKPEVLPLTAEDRERIVARICEGIRAMGDDVELQWWGVTAEARRPLLKLVGIGKPPSYPNRRRRARHGGTGSILRG